MKDLRSIPAAPRALPLLGHLVPMLRDPVAFLTSLHAHGEMVRIRIGPLPLVVICDPELTHKVLVDDRLYDKGGPVGDRTREVVGDGLGTCPHSAHRRLRRLTQPAFHPSRLPGYSEAMTACIDEATGSWRAGQILDVQTEMMRVTSKITVTTMFSSTLPPAELDRILDDIRIVLAGIVRRVFLIPPLDRLPTPQNRSYVRARARLYETFDQIIAGRRADGTDRGDLLSAMVAAQDSEDGGRGMTDEELIDTVVTFFIGGTETSAAVLAFALDLLARHTDIAQRLHAEADSVLGGAAATHADLPRLPLAQRVINETLRLRSPAWFVTRAVTADTQLGGHLLPAGTNLAYSPYLIHHLPGLFDNPDTFDPDRWDPQRPQPPRHSHIPFGTGARKCIGDTFAMTEATLALATIAARWRLEHLPGQHMRFAPSFALRPRELRMRATPWMPATAL